MTRPVRTIYNLRLDVATDDVPLTVVDDGAF